MPVVMEMTFTPKAVACGTDVSFVQEDIPDRIPIKFCTPGGGRHLSRPRRRSWSLKCRTPERLQS